MRNDLKSMRNNCFKAYFTRNDEKCDLLKTFLIL